MEGGLFFFPFVFQTACASYNQYELPVPPGETLDDQGPKSSSQSSKSERGLQSGPVVLSLSGHTPTCPFAHTMGLGNSVASLDCLFLASLFLLRAREEKRPEGEGNMARMDSSILLPLRNSQSFPSSPSQLARLADTVRW